MAPELVRTTRRPSRSAVAIVAIAVGLFGVAAALAGPRVHAEPVPCLRLEAAALPGGDPRALPVVALPGHVKDLGGAVPAAFRFERDLGDFRMRYTLAPEDARWGVGHATLADARTCDTGGLPLDVPTPSSDLALRRGPDDVYVLTAGAAAPTRLDVPFRSVPAGTRLVWSGLLPAALAAVTLFALALALAVARTVKARAARHARILAAPPRPVSPYRNENVEGLAIVDARAQLDAWQALWRRRALGLIALSVPASAAAIWLAVFS
jgi:hypothetical protein